MKLKELPQIMSLSTEEKLDLIHDLWESIYPKVEQNEVSDEKKSCSMNVGKNISRIPNRL
jgi:hypothetical protein